MPSFDFKKLLPHVYSIIAFLVIAFFFSYPQLDGLKLYQSDHVQWQAMAKEGMDWHEKTGENVMWSNSMFGGMPTFTYYVGEVNNYMYPIQGAIMNVLGKPAGFLILAMLGFYILALALGFNKWLRVAGAIAYAFSTYNITLIEGGHETKMWALAYVPMVIAGLLVMYRGKYWTGVPLLGMSLALLLTTSHYQIMYYAIIIIIGLVITLFITALKEQQLKRFFIASGICLVTALVSVGPSLQIFLSTLEYNKTTMRGGESELTINHDANKKSGGLDKDYAFAWSNTWGESFTVLVPMLYGGSNNESLGENSTTYEVMTGMGVPEQSAADFVGRGFPGYWGPQPFTGGPFYFGAIICFLFVLGMMIIKSPHKWWILAVCVLAFLMSLGKHFPAFNYFLFDILPGFNKFRIPNMILVIPQLLFPLLGIWALNDVLTDKISKEEIWKKTKMSGIIVGGLCLVLALGGSIFFDFKSYRDPGLVEQLAKSFNNEEAAKKVVSAIQSDRSSMAMKSGLTSALYIALALGLIWAYTKDKVKGHYVALGITALLAIDLLSVDTRYLNEDNYIDADQYAAQLDPRPVDKQIMQDPDPYYRVLDLSVDPFNNAMQAAHHKCIGGYSPAKMEIYQDMIDVHMRQGFNQQVMNMLNAKYFISPQGPKGEAVPIPNPDACGNAWFVENIQWEETADSEILALQAPPLGSPDTLATSFRPLKTAVMRSSYKTDLQGYTPGKDSAAYVKLAKYGLDEISYVSSNSKDGLAVFSDIYYPYGWKAYVDGKETPIYKADYLLRAVKLPAGEHKIEFVFHPEKFYTADKVALVSSLLLILSVFGGIFMAVKGDKKTA